MCMDLLAPHRREPVTASRDLLNRVVPDLANRVDPFAILGPDEAKYARAPWTSGAVPGISGSPTGATRPTAPHVMLLLEPPRPAAVARALASPHEGIRLDVVERPAELYTLAILAAQHNAIPLGSPFHPDDHIEGGRHERQRPPAGLGVYPPHPGYHFPFVARAGIGVAQEDVLQRVAVEDPAEEDLAALVANAAILGDERVVGVPRPHEASEEVRLAPERGVRRRRRQNRHHVATGVCRRAQLAGAMCAGTYGRSSCGGSHPPRQLPKWPHRDSSLRGFAVPRSCVYASIDVSAPKGVAA